MDKISIELDVQRTAAVPPLEFQIKLDGVVVHRLSTDSEHVQFELVDDEANHELEFELLNKLPDHTKIDQDNNILQDALIEITNITVDGINIDQICHDHSEYQHNYNGSGTAVCERFYGHMGCNGIVSLKFTTPIYLWLLETM